MILLHRPTVENIMSDDPAAIKRTIEEGGWGGCPVPGDEEWEQALPDEPYVMTGKYLSLAIHYFEKRHPGMVREIGIAATMVDGFTRGMFGGFGQDQDPLYAKALAAVTAFAGGRPAPPGEDFGFTPPMDEAGKVLLPGDPADFTRAAVNVLEAICFVGEEEARRIASEFLAQGGDLAARAAEIFHRVSRWNYGEKEAPIHCFDCGAKNLERFYTSKKLNYHLCPGCFEAREKAGRAKEGTV